MKLFRLISFFVLLIIAFNGCVYIKKTAQKGSIIEQMYRHWAGKWGRNMQFEQHVYLYKNDSLIRQEIWQELLSSPKNLHIRFNGFETGNGALFRNDSTYYFTNNQITRKEARIHHLLLLGFDVYFLSPAYTEKQLKSLGFNLELSYEKDVKGRKIVVVGTDKPDDEKTTQFWVDKEQMYLTRVITNTNGTVSDIEMEGYKMIDSYPVATEITFKRNGKVFMVEKYFNISFPKKVDAKNFETNMLKDAKW